MFLFFLVSKLLQTYLHYQGQHIKGSAKKNTKGDHHLHLKSSGSSVIWVDRSFTSSPCQKKSEITDIKRLCQKKIIIETHNVVRIDEDLVIEALKLDIDDSNRLKHESKNATFVINPIKIMFEVDNDRTAVASNTLQGVSNLAKKLVPFCQCSYHCVGK